MDHIKTMYNDYKNLSINFSHETLDIFIKKYLPKGSASGYHAMIIKTVPNLLESGKVSCSDLDNYSNMFFQLQTGDLVPFTAIGIDGQVSDYKPACTYGAKCYRKNKDHNRDFFHPREEGMWVNGIGTLLGSFCNKGGSKKRKKREKTKKKRKRRIMKSRRRTKRRNNLFY